MAYGTVYQILNTANGRSYVGQTVQSLGRRWGEHLSYAAGSDRPLYRAMRKYGLDAFVLRRIVDVSRRAELDAAELYFGELLHALAPEGYCLKLGEGNGRHCEATKEKIREKRRLQDEETGLPSPRFGTGEARDGVCPCGQSFRSYRDRKYCSAKCYGKFDHDELVVRFSKAGATATSKRVKDLTTGKIYASARTASKELGIPWGSFSRIVRKGGRFLYVTEEPQ